MHNGSSSEHWDVVDKNGKNHRNVYPDGKEKNENSSSSISLGDFFDSLLESLIPTDDVLTLIFSMLPLIIFLSVFIIFIPLLIPLLV